MIIPRFDTAFEPALIGISRGTEGESDITAHQLSIAHGCVAASVWFTMRALAVLKSAIGLHILYKAFNSIRPSASGRPGADVDVAGAATPYQRRHPRDAPSRSETLPLPSGA